MEPNQVNRREAGVLRSRRRWGRVVRLLQAALGLWVAFAVWLVALDQDPDTPDVIPPTDEQFSLDLEVIGTANHELIYAVEQRARPAYRILSLEPSTGAVDTIFTVPEDAIIYGISLNETGTTMAVAYSTDFDINGSGIWMLDIASGSISEAVAAETNVFLLDPTWSEDGTSILVTRVDRTSANEQLSVARARIDTGEVEIAVPNGIRPVVVDTDIYYLTVDDDNARHAIGRLDSSNLQETIPVGDGTFDLDHLLPEPGGNRLVVAALDTKESSFITFGSEAGAHGNHDVPSTWWTIELARTSPSSDPVDSDPTLIHDAISTDAGLIAATKEGISLIGPSGQIDLVHSRAIRLVAG